MVASKILPWLGNEKPSSIAVVGDLILDEYVEGQVNRISPEAPVPVHLADRSIFRAGGAANGAMNVQLAGGEAHLFGVTGNDTSAKELFRILQGAAVDLAGVLQEKERPTIRKTRISANRQQIVRVDWEKFKPINEKLQKDLLKNLKKTNVDAILLSDYGKGGLGKEFVGSVIEYAKELQVKVIIDPKGEDYSKYSGADLITPNRSEATRALGLDPEDSNEPLSLASQLQQRFSLRNVLLTLGSKGMLLVTEDGKSKLLPAKARDVFDVSGAGDTVAAIMSLGLASGSSYEQSMEIANMAASIVVGKWGTAPVHRSELIDAAEKEINGEFSTARKLVDLGSLIEIIGPRGQRARKVAFTNGCFDLLHEGHLSYLEKSRSQGDLLVVGVNSDESVSRNKGKSRPILSCEQRMRLLAGLSCVDYVVSFNEDTPERLIEKIVPDVLLKGADWAVEEIVGAEIVKKAGGVVANIDLVPGISTSEIIRRVRDGESVL